VGADLILNVNEARRLKVIKELDDVHIDMTGRLGQVQHRLLLRHSNRLLFLFDCCGSFAFFRLFFLSGWRLFTLCLSLLIDVFLSNALSLFVKYRKFILG
jgi:hypothetical protein